MRRRAFALAAAAGLVTAIALGLRPHLFALWLWPTSRDAALWILRAIPGEGWGSWVLASRHFVGYRPVAAATYTIDAVQRNAASWPYLATDLALHAGCAALIYVLYRRAAPRLSRWGGVAAAALFVAHPLAAEVAPHLARRSYSLATLLGLAALCAIIPGRLRLPLGLSWGRAAAVGLLAALAVLSNEVAITFVPAAALLLLLLRFDPRAKGVGRATVSGAGVIVGIGAALALRVAATGGLGGYATESSPLTRAPEIAAEIWKSLTLSSGATRGGYLAAVLIAAYYVITAHGSIRDQAAAAETLPPTAAADGEGSDVVVSAHVHALPALLVMWLAVATLLYAPLGVWFPRQNYPLLVPFSLLLGVCLADTVRRSRLTLALSLAWLRAILHFVPQATAIAWLLAHSPLLHGPDSRRVNAWKRTDALLREMHGDLADLPQGAVVALVVPYYERPEADAVRAREGTGRPPVAAQLPADWIGGLLREREVELQTLLAYSIEPGEIAAACRSSAAEGSWVVEFEGPRPYWLLGGQATPEQLPGSTRIALAPDLLARSTHLYVHDGSTGTLVDIGATPR